MKQGIIFLIKAKTIDNLKFKAVINKTDAMIHTKVIKYEHYNELKSKYQNLALVNLSANSPDPMNQADQVQSLNTINLCLERERPLLLMEFKGTNSETLFSNQIIILEEPIIPIAEVRENYPYLCKNEAISYLYGWQLFKNKEWELLEKYLKYIIQNNEEQHFLINDFDKFVYKILSSIENPEEKDLKTLYYGLQLLGFGEFTKIPFKVELLKKEQYLQRIINVKTKFVTLDQSSTNIIRTKVAFKGLTNLMIDYSLLFKEILKFSQICPCMGDLLFHLKIYLQYLMNYEMNYRVIFEMDENSKKDFDSIFREDLSNSISKDFLTKNFEQVFKDNLQPYLNVDKNLLTVDNLNFILPALYLLLKMESGNTKIQICNFFLSSVKNPIIYECISTFRNLYEDFRYPFNIWNSNLTFLPVCHNSSEKEIPIMHSYYVYNSQNILMYFQSLEKSGHKKTNLLELIGYNQISSENLKLKLNINFYDRKIRKNLEALMFKFIYKLIYQAIFNHNKEGKEVHKILDEFCKLNKNLEYFFEKIKKGIIDQNESNFTESKYESSNQNKSRKMEIENSLSNKEISTRKLIKENIKKEILPKFKPYRLFKDFVDCFIKEENNKFSFDMVTFLMLKKLIGHKSFLIIDSILKIFGNNFLLFNADISSPYELILLGKNQELKSDHLSFILFNEDKESFSTLDCIYILNKEQLLAISNSFPKSLFRSYYFSNLNNFIKLVSIIMSNLDSNKSNLHDTFSIILEGVSSFLYKEFAIFMEKDFRKIVLKLSRIQNSELRTEITKILQKFFFEKFSQRNFFITYIQSERVMDDLFMNYVQREKLFQNINRIAPYQYSSNEILIEEDKIEQKKSFYFTENVPLNNDSIFHSIDTLQLFNRNIVVTKIIEELTKNNQKLIDFLKFNIVYYLILLKLNSQENFKQSISEIYKGKIDQGKILIDEIDKLAKPFSNNNNKLENNCLEKFNLEYLSKITNNLQGIICSIDAIQLQLLVKFFFAKHRFAFPLGVHNNIESLQKDNYPLLCLILNLIPTNVELFKRNFQNITKIGKLKNLSIKNKLNCQTIQLLMSFEGSNIHFIRLTKLIDMNIYSLWKLFCAKVIFACDEKIQEKRNDYDFIFGFFDNVLTQIQGATNFEKLFVLEIGFQNNVLLKAIKAYNSFNYEQKQIIFLEFKKIVFEEIQLKFLKFDAIEKMKFFKSINHQNKKILKKENKIYSQLNKFATTYNKTFSANKGKETSSNIGWSKCEYEYVFKNLSDYNILKEIMVSKGFQYELPTKTEETKNVINKCDILSLINNLNKIFIKFKPVINQLLFEEIQKYIQSISEIKLKEELALKLINTIKMHILKPRISEEENRIIISGMNILLSEVQKNCSKKDIVINATNKIFVDCDLDCHSGNLHIYTPCIEVIGKHIFDLSGISYNSNIITKADKGSHGEDGKPGKKGNDGDDGGNIYIYSNEYINIESLIINSQGGNGGPGQEGGDGGDGLNGEDGKDGILTDENKNYLNCVAYGTKGIPGEKGGKGGKGGEGGNPGLGGFIIYIKTMPFFTSNIIQEFQNLEIEKHKSQPEFKHFQKDKDGLKGRNGIDGNKGKDGNNGKNGRNSYYEHKKIGNKFTSKFVEFNIELIKQQEDTKVEGELLWELLPKIQVPDSEIQPTSIPNNITRDELIPKEISEKPGIFSGRNKNIFNEKFAQVLNLFCLTDFLKNSIFSTSFFEKNTNFQEELKNQIDNYNTSVCNLNKEILHREDFNISLSNFEIKESQYQYLCDVLKYVSGYRNKNEELPEKSTEILLIKESKEKTNNNKDPKAIPQNYLENISFNITINPCKTWDQYYLKFRETFFFREWEKIIGKFRILFSTNESITEQIALNWIEDLTKRIQTYLKFKIKISIDREYILNFRLILSTLFDDLSLCISLYCIIDNQNKFSNNIKKLVYLSEINHDPDHLDQNSSLSLLFSIYTYINSSNYANILHFIKNCKGGLHEKYHIDLFQKIQNFAEAFSDLNLENLSKINYYLVKGLVKNSMHPNEDLESKELKNNNQLNSGINDLMCEFFREENFLTNDLLRYALGLFQNFNDPGNMEELFGLFKVENDDENTKQYLNKILNEFLSKILFFQNKQDWYLFQKLLISKLQSMENISKIGEFFDLIINKLSCDALNSKLVIRSVILFNANNWCREIHFSRIIKLISDIYTNDKENQLDLMIRLSNPYLTNTILELIFCKLIEEKSSSLIISGNEFTLILEKICKMFKLIHKKEDSQSKDLNSSNETHNNIKTATFNPNIIYEKLSGLPLYSWIDTVNKHIIALLFEKFSITISDSEKLIQNIGFKNSKYLEKLISKFYNIEKENIQGFHEFLKSFWEGRYIIDWSKKDEISKINDFKILKDYIENQKINNKDKYIDQNLILRLLKEDNLHLKSKDIEQLVKKIEGLLMNVDKQKFSEGEIKKNLDQHKEQKDLSDFCTNNPETILSYFYNAVKVKCNFALTKTQIMAIWFLINPSNQGVSAHKLVQISTGEGKTLIICLIAIYKSLLGKKVHIVTSSTVLAENSSRDKKLNQLYSLFGCKINNICDKESIEKESIRKTRYIESNILYGDIQSFQRDYLLTKYYDKEISEDKNEVIILDEVDYIMLDKFMDVCYIPFFNPDLHFLLEIFAAIWNLVNLKTNMDKNQIFELISKLINKNDILIPKYLEAFVKNNLNKWIINGILSKSMNLDDEFFLSDFNKEKLINIIDKDSGTTQYLSKWSDGIEQFLNLKFSGKVSSLELKGCFISNYHYVNQYSEILGLSGTLGSFNFLRAYRSLYKFEISDILIIPRSKFRYFIQEETKICNSPEKWYEEIKEEIKNNIEKRPILILNENIMTCKIMSSEIKKMNESNKTFDIHEYFTQDKRPEIITKNFETPIGPKNLIISTNLSGRGLDYNINSNAIKEGGLHIIITYFHENERDFEQAKGRAARNGKPGSCRLILLSDSEINSVEFFQYYFEKKEIEKYTEITKSKFKKLDNENILLKKYFELEEKIMKEIIDTKLNQNLLLIKKESLRTSWALFINSLDLNNNHEKSQGVLNDYQVEFEKFSKEIISLNNLKENEILFTKSSLQYCILASEYHNLGAKEANKEKYEKIERICYQKAIQEDPYFSEIAYYILGICELEELIKTPPIDQETIALKLKHIKFLFQKAIFSIKLRLRSLFKIKGYVICTKNEFKKNSSIYLDSFEKQNIAEIKAYEKILKMIEIIGSGDITDNEIEERCFDPLIKDKFTKIMHVLINQGNYFKKMRLSKKIVADQNSTNKAIGITRKILKYNKYVSEVQTILKSEQKNRLISKEIFKEKLKNDLTNEKKEKIFEESIFYSIIKLPSIKFKNMQDSEPIPFQRQAITRIVERTCSRILGNDEAKENNLLVPKVEYFVDSKIGDIFLIPLNQMDIHNVSLKHFLVNLSHCENYFIKNINFLIIQDKSKENKKSVNKYYDSLHPNIIKNLNIKMPFVSIYQTENFMKYESVNEEDEIGKLVRLQEQPKIKEEEAQNNLIYTILKTLFKSIKNLFNYAKRTESKIDQFISPKIQKLLLKIGWLFIQSIVFKKIPSLTPLLIIINYIPRFTSGFETLQGKYSLWCIHHREEIVKDVIVTNKEIIDNFISSLTSSNYYSISDLEIKISIAKVETYLTEQLKFIQYPDPVVIIFGIIISLKDSFPENFFIDLIDKLYNEFFIPLIKDFFKSLISSKEASDKETTIQPNLNSKFNNYYNISNSQNIISTVNSNSNLMKDCISDPNAKKIKECMDKNKEELIISLKALLNEVGKEVKNIAEEKIFQVIEKIYGIYVLPRMKQFKDNLGRLLNSLIDNKEIFFCHKNEHFRTDNDSSKTNSKQLILEVIEKVFINHITEGFKSSKILDHMITFFENKDGFKLTEFKDILKNVRIDDYKKLFRTSKISSELLIQDFNFIKKLGEENQQRKKSKYKAEVDETRNQTEINTKISDQSILNDSKMQSMPVTPPQNDHKELKEESQINLFQSNAKIFNLIFQNINFESKSQISFQTEAALKVFKKMHSNQPRKLYIPLSLKKFEMNSFNQKHIFSTSFDLVSDFEPFIEGEYSENNNFNIFRSEPTRKCGISKWNRAKSIRANKLNSILSEISEKCLFCESKHSHSKIHFKSSTSINIKLLENDNSNEENRIPISKDSKK